MQLEIGDQIKITPGIVPPYTSTIIRVTKTKAVGDYPIRDSVFLEFKREYDDNKWIRPYKREKWDTTRRELIKIKNENIRT